MAEGPVELVSIYDTSGYAYDVAISGHFAYVGDGSAGLQIVDISNPALPIHEGEYEPDGSVRGVTVSGTYGFLVGDAIGLEIVNVSNPNNPIFLGGWRTDTVWYTRDVAISGEHAYVNYYDPFTANLQILNISNPLLPEVYGKCDTSNYAYGIAVSNNYAYIADGYVGLQIVNISDPCFPVRVGGYDTNGTANAISLLGNYAYVADGYAGLQIINISNPVAPIYVGGYDTTGYAYDVYVLGNYAYVADGDSGFQIINISNPALPVLVGGYNTSGRARSVIIVSSYAYIADGDDGLVILKVGSEPSNQPQFKAPWAGTAKISQGNKSSYSHNTCHNREFDPNNCEWENTWALDIALSSGSDVLSPADGEVNYIDEDSSGSGGIEMALDHIGPTGQKFTTVYLHLSQIIAKSGSVKQGQVIAKSGATGNVPAHLHFHLWNRTGSRDSHTLSIERLVLKEVGEGNDFREFDARKGELDDSVVAGKFFVSSNNINPPSAPPEPNIPSLPPKIEPDTPEQDKLIILTHGWKPPWDKSEGPGWVERTYEAINAMITAGEIDQSWKVEMWNWSSDTNTPWGAQSVGTEYGKIKGDTIASPMWNHVHFIGHSAGDSVIAAAAEVLTKSRTEGNYFGDIHLTFLDPFTSLWEDDRYGRTLNFNRDWADNYFTVDMVGDLKNINTWSEIGLLRWTSQPFKYAHNVDISSVDPGIINNHDFPCDWYYATITGHYPDDGPPLNGDNIFEGRQYGFQRSLEAGDANWQESLTLPVGNKPAIGSLTQRIMKSVSKLNQNLNNSIVLLKEQNKGVILGNLLRMWINPPEQQQLLTSKDMKPLGMLTNSSMWGQVLLEMPPGTNSVKFTYQFTGIGPGYLTVYFNENLILIGDQRFDGNTPHESPQILVADFMQDHNWLTFRIDEINEPNAEVSISNLEIGTITTKIDINADLIVNFIDFAAFAQQWTAIDCNDGNSWCQGADFDEDGAVDINDAAALALSWLWTPPKRIQADLNISGTVDFFDFNIFAGQWGEDCISPDWCYGSDFNKSGRVDVIDLGELVQSWLSGS